MKLYTVLSDIDGDSEILLITERLSEAITAARQLDVTLGTAGIVDHTEEYIRTGRTHYGGKIWWNYNDEEQDEVDIFASETEVGFDSILARAVRKVIDEEFNDERWIPRPQTPTDLNNNIIFRNNQIEKIRRIICGNLPAETAAAAAPPHVERTYHVSCTANCFDCMRTEEQCRVTFGDAGVARRHHELGAGVPPQVQSNAQGTPQNQVQCDDCSGSGSVDCPSCRGTGYVAENADMLEEDDE